MDNFETDNQDKSNLVGDEKLMSDAVDVEQELIRVKQENRELKTYVIELEQKSSAWDDYSNMVRESTDANSLTELIINYNAINKSY